LWYFICRLGFLFQTCGILFAGCTSLPKKPIQNLTCGILFAGCTSLPKKPIQNLNFYALKKSIEPGLFKTRSKSFVPKLLHQLKYSFKLKPELHIRFFTMKKKSKRT
ncbi:hypothetical protein L9F63_010296, partial [Diploptera punctata]